jgi:ubiquinone/menaquinone biosynthesis C-methylase UbiE
MNEDYKQLYEKMHLTDRAYRQNNQGLALWKHWRVPADLSGPILEVGCGNGRLIEKLTVEGFDCIGLDCINNIYDLPDYYMHDLTGGMLPFYDNHFPWLLCFDVLEHLPERSIDFVLSEFQRVSKRQVISVAHYGSPPLHLTVKDPDWWYEKISPGFEHIVIERYPQTFVSIFVC